MTSMPVDHLHAVPWLVENIRESAVLSYVWAVVRWIAFFFKLASLAFVIPIGGLIVFDFCLGIYRLYRPRSRESLPRKGTELQATVPAAQTPASLNSSTKPSPDLSNMQRRAVYSPEANDY
ncbi:hypothetical protein GGR56DRAFT_423133 [Xylariaceae sp. FL0804]|nr:hypothetical protein GGR56DRAFT_423133 [Xylariaceae sp. FL0804]